MAQQYPRAGAQDTSAYLAPGIPWVTSSALPTAAVLHVSFPYVTNVLYIGNSATTTSKLRFGFTENGLTGNPASESRYFDIPENTTIEFKFRVKELFFTSAKRIVVKSKHQNM